MLYDTATRIQQTDFAQPAAHSTVDQLEQVLLFFDDHAEHEDAFILPHLHQQNAGLIDELEKDHEVDHQLAHTLFTGISNWRTATDSDERKAAGQRLFYAFNEFVAFNLYHMNKEETVLLPLLWEHYTDEDILHMEHQILQTISPQTLLTESRWMIRYINAPEAIDWLTGVKRGAPADVYNGFMQLAADELPADRLNRVQMALALI